MFRKIGQQSHNQDITGLIENQLGKWAVKPSLKEMGEKIKSRSLKSVIEFIYKKEAAYHDKKHIFIKENRIHTFMIYIFAAFPHSKFIHMVRDPRDMALSWKLSPNHPGGVIKAAHIWKEDQEKAIEAYGFLKEMDRIFRLSYEDLLMNPEDVCRDLCVFLETKFYPGMLDFYKDNLTIENSKRLRNWENLQKPIMKANFNKYRKNLSYIENQYIESVCKNEMEILGYHPEYLNGKADLEHLEDMIKKNNEQSLPKPEILGEKEQKIRDDRLKIINRILSRRLFQEQ